MSKYNITTYGEIEKVLTKRQFDKLYQKYQNGDLLAREKIILSNINLVAYMLKYVDGVTIDNFDDYVSYGVIGLINALDTYDISKDIRFSTYASKCILYECLKRTKCLSLLPGQSYYQINENEIVDDSLTRNTEDKDLIFMARLFSLQLTGYEKTVFEGYYGLAGVTKSMKVLAEEIGICRSYLDVVLTECTDKFKSFYGKSDAALKLTKIYLKELEKVLLKVDLDELLVNNILTDIEYKFLTTNVLLSNDTLYNLIMKLKKYIGKEEKQKRFKRMS